MGVEPPYLYDAPSRPRTFDSIDFDPKAVTRASYASTQPRPKQEGPYINFNKHPDSYIIVPYGTADLPPLPTNTKKKVTVVRWIQFALRLTQLITALGLLACVICITGTQDVQGWIIRVPPAWDAMIATYAVYHLVRPAKARTAASSSSYHAFSLFMDLGLIPFMVFTAFSAEQNWTQTVGTLGRWRSLFGTDAATNKLFFATFLVSIALGALHMISVFFDAYLVVIFRKISAYPPDMSPLEDKITVDQSRHKYKDSDASLAMCEKKSTSLSGSTVNLNSPSARPMSFYQSRTNLNTAHSGHTMDTARMSNVDLAGNASLFQQPMSARASRPDVQASSHSRPGSRGQSNRGSLLADRDPMPDRPYSAVSTQPSRFSADKPRYSTDKPAPQASVPAKAQKQQQKEALLQDNWYVTEEDQADLSNRMPDPIFARNLDEERQPQAGEVNQAQLPEPLRTNLPSPPPKSPLRGAGDFYFDDMPTPSRPTHLAPGQDHGTNGCEIGRALTISSAVSASSTYSPSPSRSPSPKRRYYGDLAAAQRGVRGPGDDKQQPPVSTMNFAGGVAQGRFFPEASVQQPRPSASPERTKIGREEWSAGPGKARVISRTGADVADSNVMYVDDGMARKKGRQVSGKAAEEGRGMGWGMRKREVSGVA